MLLVFDLALTTDLETVARTLILCTLKPLPKSIIKVFVGDFVKSNR